MYIIEYSYSDGNTFGSESGLKSQFDYQFETKELAKAALARMREHHDWFVGTQNAYAEDDKPEPSWLKERPAEVQGRWKDSFRWFFNVEGNDGTEVWLSGSTYLGYFASLEGARVTRPSEFDDDCSFGYGFY